MGGGDAQREQAQYIQRRQNSTSITMAASDSKELGVYLLDVELWVSGRAYALSASRSAGRERQHSFIGISVMFDYPQILHDGVELFQRWHARRAMPRFDSPRLHEWQPADGTSANVAIAWSGSSWSPRLVVLINQVIAEFCVDEPDSWSRQYIASAEFFGSFFGPNRRPSSLNLVTVTPSRIPKELWPALGRPVLRESQSLIPKCLISDAPLTAESLLDAPPIPMNRLRWAPRPGTSRNRLRVALVKAQRNNEGTGMTYTRAFLYDREFDADSVMAGQVPAVADTVDGVGGIVRVHSPMVQYWRLFSDGSVEVINFGLCRGSGLLTDFRWTRGALDTVITQGAEFARPLLELERVGGILVRI